MKRLLKSWVFWVFIAVPTAWVAIRLTYRHVRTHACSTCFRERVETQWRFGVEGKWKVPLLPVSVEEFDTRVHLDGWTGTHEHVSGWVVTRSGPGRVYVGTGGLLESYETNAAFRVFMLAKRERGEIARNAFLAALNPFVAHNSLAIVDGRFTGWWEEFQNRSPFP